MKRALFAFAPIAAAVAIAGCGGSSSSSSQPTPAPATPAGNTAATTSGAAASTTSSNAATTVSLASSKFGKILVGPSGRTLYDFVADKTTKSTCYGACASIWPPLTVSGAPKAGPGVSASLLGTTKRTDGSTEVTYNGHPLYYYAADSQPGDTTGQALNQFGAPWYVLTANGKEVTHG
jgi:predicted lipoprotein with Yx(FWY)xxD motif